MQQIQIKKRLAEITGPAKRRLMKDRLTEGDKHALINALNKIDLWGRKANAQLMAGRYRAARYDARTQEDFAEQEKYQAAVFAALLAGRRIDLTNADEFHVSQMHTTIFKIRRKIDRQGLPYLLCDEWVRPGEGRRPYKRYWLEDKPEDINQ